MTWLPPYERDVNTVFQNYALFPHLTIYENVAFGLRRKKVKGDEIKSRVTDMLKLVELPGFEKRKPTQISGGQAQRVALARALINRPPSSSSTNRSARSTSSCASRCRSSSSGSSRRSGSRSST